MSLEITLAGTRIPTDVSALKSFKADLKLAFELDSALSSLLDTTLEKVPANASKTSVTYSSPAASWNPGGGPVQFGLQGGASGSIEIITSGDVVAYTDGLESPQQKSVAAAANTAYMKLTLNFTISANTSANYSGGSYGVKSALDTSDSYAIAFCKAFPPSTVVRNAIALTFESFVLPLHKDTLSQMSDGDYLLHEFDGNLHLSFGAYGGLDQVLYAGQSSADVLKAFGSPLATLSASAKPEVQAGVSLDFSFEYATRFEALLSKTGSSAKLHLFRSSKSASSTVLKAGLTFDANLSASVTSHAQVVTDSVVKAAGGTTTPAGAALNQVLTAANAAGEIDKYVSEVNDKLTSWLNRANGLQANLQVAIETSKSRTILAGYDFDLSSQQYPAAWQAAISGNFVAAFKTSAVTLDAGSGLEREYQRRTSFSCNLFNLWSMKSWSEFTSNVSLVYAGNNVFHLLAKVDRTIETDSMGARRSMNIYFSAAADVSAGGQVSNADIDLHIDLTAESNPKAAAAIATMLSAIGGGPVCDALARNMRAFAASSKNGTAQLQVTIPAGAYVHINCDPYIGSKPQTTSTALDAQNWAAFARAADDLNAWPLRGMSTVSDQGLANLKKFTGWEDLNQTANGSTKPNRMLTGNAMNLWPSDFPRVDDGDRHLIVYSMLAGQAFMNFCACLRDLAHANDVDSAGKNWNSLVELITSAIRDDLNVDFLRPAALATIRLCKAPILDVTGPADAAVPTDHFAVSITL